VAKKKKVGDMYAAKKIKKIKITKSYGFRAINSNVTSFVYNHITDPSPFIPMFFATYIHFTKTFHHLPTSSSYPFTIATTMLKLVATSM
jgi:hypothetical protein